jgi:PAS domain S-box-containing protein
VEEKTRYVHRDGHTIWVRLNISLIREDNGEPFCFVGHVEDTTERKQAEEALRESEKRFRTFADGCPSMLWVTGPMGKIQFINRALREFCGATCEDVEAGNWQMPLHPDDAPECFAAFELAIRGRAPFSAESRLRRADGEFRILGTRAEPRLSTRGEYMGHIGLSADITQRKQGEQARQFQHSLIRTIHDVSLDGILVVNDHGKVVTSNQKFFDVWHIHSEEVPADPVDITKVVAAADPLVSACLARVKDPDAFLMRERALHADRDASDQCEIELKDGRTLERHSTSLRNEEGEYLARAWFFRDITERKQAEKVLTESENRFRIMADSCPIGIWVTGVQGEMLFVNRAYRRFCGITSEEVAPDAWKFLLHQDDAPDFFAFMNHAVKEHTAFTTERRHLRADGEWRWVESYAEPRFSLDGEFLGFVGTSKDTTDRKRAEQALQTIQERFR